MKYVTFASLRYKKGNYFLFCTRFNNRDVANASAPKEFIKRCLEMVSSRYSSEVLTVCSVANNVVDGTIPAVDNVRGVNVERAELADLSNPDFLSRFDCLILSGWRNTVSPFIQDNINEYVANGGGVILSDIRVSGETISLLDTVAPVYCRPEAEGIDQGIVLWTKEGKESYIYDASFFTLDLTIINKIRESDLSINWDLLSIHDTNYTLEEQTSDNAEVDTTPMVHSSDYDLQGAHFVAYYVATYKNGIFDIED